MIRRRELYLAISGWVALGLFVFCAAETDSLGPGVADTHEARADETAAPPGTTRNGLWLYDADGREVGMVLSKRHPLKEDNELLDAVTVYSPTFSLFFTVEMNTGEVILPGKVFYPNGNCSGAPAIRAICPDCASGFDTGVRVLGRWFRVVGGKMQQDFHYNSYFTEGSQGNCVGHGGSDTHVYPMEELPEGQNPGDFTPPLQFIFR